MFISIVCDMNVNLTLNNITIRIVEFYNAVKNDIFQSNQR